MVSLDHRLTDELQWYLNLLLLVSFVIAMSLAAIAVALYRISAFCYLVWRRDVAVTVDVRCTCGGRDSKKRE
jgi:hypothetical protein